MFGYVASIQSSEDCGLRVWGLKFRICRGFYVTGAMHHRRLPCFSLRLASVVVRCYVHNILVLAVAGLLSFGRLYAVLLWVVKFLVQLIEVWIMFSLSWFPAQPLPRLQHSACRAT